MFSKKPKNLGYGDPSLATYREGWASDSGEECGLDSGEEGVSEKSEEGEFLSSRRFPRKVCSRTYPEGISPLKVIVDGSTGRRLASCLSTYCSQSEKDMPLQTRVSREPINST
jgi:hypothetical protein